MSDPDKTDKVPIIPNADNSVSEDAPSVTHEVGWGIDKGKVRSNNEDSLAAVTVSQASEADAKSVGVYAVADGMGGHEAGEVASKLAVRTAIRELVGDVTAEKDMPENYQDWLKSAVAVANDMVRGKASETQKKMGTTLVMAVVAGHDVHIANVGDSRAYLITPEGIHRVTHDHSLVQILLDSGAISAEEAAKHPYRNVLTQAIGSEEHPQIDVFNATLGHDDALLLCSDGLWDMLNEQEIWKIVRHAPSPKEACEALVEATNAAGGRDNIAAVLVRLGPHNHDGEMILPSD
ncbi:MAG: Stp1/IreP family PP2C-type Ser/Thr phosphatase [Anaerolineae bacterium]|nr:Stp1/IreP family PP2C-type Ser/Thr phosphatase [Anaerolineae bacterium]